MYRFEVSRLQIQDHVKRLLSPGSFGQNVGKLAIGTSLGQGISLIFSPLLTRIYTAEQFGQLAAFAAVLTVLAAVISLRYEIAILLPADDKTAVHVTTLALLIVVGMSLLICAAVFVPNWTGELAGIRHYLWMVPIGAFAVGVYQVFNYWAVRAKVYSQISRTKLTQPLSRLAVQLILGLLKWGALGLLIGEVFGRINGSLLLARTAWSRNSDEFRAITWQGLKDAAFRYRRFPLVLTSAAVINTAGSAVPALLLGAWFGAKVLGWYTLVDRSMAVPTVLIGQAVSQVFSGEAARLANSDARQLNTLFSNTIRKLALVALLPSLVLLLLAPQIFSFVFGPSWQEAGIYARLMIGMTFLGFIAWPVNPTLSLLERQSLQLIWDVLRGVLAIGSLFICHALNLDARRTIFAYALAMSIGYILHMVFSKWAIKGRTREHAKRPVPLADTPAN